MATLTHQNGKVETVDETDIGAKREYTDQERARYREMSDTSWRYFVRLCWIVAVLTVLNAVISVINLGVKAYAYFTP